MKEFYAVFGNPILHSKSPQLFNAAFDFYKSESFYTRIKATNCEEIVKFIREFDIKGSNITTPFKEEVISYLGDISEEAKEIGAVNTIVYKYDELKGYNTDYLGVVRSVAEVGISVEGKNCLVIGAGGAARAAVFGLLREGAKVYISNRTIERAKDIAFFFDCEVIPLDELRSTSVKFDVIVSTLLPDVEVPLGCLSGCELFLDANYRVSRMASQVSAAGIKVIKGDRWLINQAIGAFSIFFGFEPEKHLFEAGFSIEMNYQNCKVGIINPDERNKVKDLSYDLVVTSDHLFREEISLIK